MGIHIMAVRNRTVPTMFSRMNCTVEREREGERERVRLWMDRRTVLTLHHSPSVLISGLSNNSKSLWIKSCEAG